MTSWQKCWYADELQGLLHNKSRLITPGSEVEDRGRVYQGATIITKSVWQYEQMSPDCFDMLGRDKSDVMRGAASWHDDGKILENHIELIRRFGSS